MNELSQAPDQEEIVGSTAIEVAAPAPKPKPKVTKPKPPPPPKPSAPPPPSVAALLSGNASINVEIPGIDFENLGGAEGLLAGSDDVVHTSDTVDTPPQPVQVEPPQYPRRAQDKAIEGFVTLSLLINVTGGIERMKVIESKPPGVFEDAAKQAVRQWKFSPGAYQGKPVKTWANQTVRFSLNR
ncbi:MAG: energy transducer TonB [Myxococcota bacterium]